MKPLDHSLQRLFQAAARARVDAPTELPARVEMRVLAQWRQTQWEPVTDWLGIMFRRGLIGATAVLLLSIAWSWQAARATAASESTFVDEVMQENVTP